MTVDCLICFQPLRLPDWYPPLDCTCRPALHKTCWQSWVAHTGYETCVICREPQPPPPPRPILAALLFLPQEPRHPRQPPVPWWRNMEQMTTLLGVFFIVWILLLLSFPQKAIVYVPPPQPGWYRDEL